MHHRAAKFIYKGNLPAGKRTCERRGALNAEVFPRDRAISLLHISVAGASPGGVRRHLRQYRHAPTGLFNRIRMRRRVRTTLIRCIKPKGNAMRTRLTINGTVFGPSELVIPLSTYRVAIQAEFASSVSKARGTCRSITLRPPLALAEDATADDPPMTGGSSANPVIHLPLDVGRQCGGKPPFDSDNLERPLIDPVNMCSRP
jgi:hypothetical protein